MSETTIPVGAPRHSQADGPVGYFWTLPITATPPATAVAEPTEGTAVSGGFVGEEGPTLTADVEQEIIRDWNLDQVITVKTGNTATLEIPVFGFGADQAKLIYGEDSVVETAGGFRIAWAGELAERRYFVLDLAGVNGNGRLVVDGQVASPGSVQLQKNAAITHTLTINLFKNPAFKDAKDRSAYFDWMEDAAGAGA